MPAAAALHAAVDVAGAEDERRLDAEVVHALDLGGERLDALRARPVGLVAQQGLAGELQEDALEGSALGRVAADLALGLGGHSLPTL